MSRSTSFCAWPRAASLSTAPPCCSFCWFAWSALVLSASSADFFCVSVCTFPLATLPSLDSAAIRCKSTNAIRKGAAGGPATAGGACAKAGALKANTLNTEATVNLVI